jgi:chemotaxis protein methyltransferase CheR
MLLAQHLPAESGWDTRILATDISNRVLERARTGIYDAATSVEIPKGLLHRFMLRGFADQQGRVKVKTDIQEMIEFRRLNLNQHPYAVEGPYDAILCRNVLIYFNADSRQRAVSNLVGHLVAGGYLFVGHAENLTSLSAHLRNLEPTIYVKTARSESSATLNSPERQKPLGASAGR